MNSPLTMVTHEQSRKGATKRFPLASVLLLLIAGFPLNPPAAQIDQVAPGTLERATFLTFDTLVGGPAPGTNYDGIVTELAGHAALAERFVGEGLVPVGPFDSLVGAPANPLNLQAGAANRNLVIQNEVVCGLGNLGYPLVGASGEGSIAVRFDVDQFEMGFDVVGANGGTATVDFYERDGTRIDTIVITNLQNKTYGFRRFLGLPPDIAGFSIYNNDPGGICLDNITYAGILIGWNASLCPPSEEMYAIYEGRLDTLRMTGYSHTEIDCLVPGFVETVRMAMGNRYYLVVPLLDQQFEGSYGVDSNGFQRPTGLPFACRPMQALVCPEPLPPDPFEVPPPTLEVDLVR